MFVSVLFALRNIHRLYCIQKSNSEHSNPQFAVIVFKMKIPL